MDLLFCLNCILTDFRLLFNDQNFVLFCAFIKGFVLCPGRKTVTGIYTASRPSVRYWSLVKFLSRGKWDASAVAMKLLSLLQAQIANWVYVYDETKAIKTGKNQVGLHFFRNYRYRKRNTNQSKFHWGHQFGALGLLCNHFGQTVLFPIWVKMIQPQTKKSNSLGIFKQIVKRIPKGLIIFDRGFNRKKIFSVLLDFGHHLLCRAKSNAVFYRLPQASEHPKRGRRRKYGKRISWSRMRFSDQITGEQLISMASIICRTKMCPQIVRLVVVRTRLKKSKPYRYFVVFTTDLQLSVEEILGYYRSRWKLEIAFRDAKQHFGFDAYQVKSNKSINRFVQLSFVAASITQWVFLKSESIRTQMDVEEILSTLGIHWYHPAKLTRGLMIAYLRKLFSATIPQGVFSQKMAQPQVGISP
jgi:hypothetical protein